MAYDFDLACIGSGPAGQRAAVQAAKLGKKAVVIEREFVVGGVCLHTGTIPSKTFREAVLHFAQRPDARPSLEDLLDRINRVVARETEVLGHQLHRNGVMLLRGHAAFRDPHTLMLETEGSVREFTAANVLIAVGTKPAPPPGVAVDREVVATSDDVVGLKRLPRTVVVVGGGVVGMEYASMLATLGMTVSVVDQRERVLDFVDGEIVDELVHQMRSRNVTFRFGEAVRRLDIAEGPPRRAVTVLESGKRIVADTVLFSVGRLGATEGLNLDAAGLDADDRGRLKVDHEFRTRVPHIFAAGDVIGYPSLAATSSEQGRLAACHAFGITAPALARHFPIGIYAIPEISMVGPTERELTEARIPYETGVARYREIARGQILGDDSGLVKLLFHRDDGRLLGVHAIGTGATELIHVGQAVLALGGGLDYFLQTVFNYPTLAECYKVAALNAANKLQE
jgi:NAD(P) transhydrogenase